MSKNTITSTVKTVERNSTYYTNILLSILSWPNSTLSKTYDFLDFQENKIKDKLLYSFFLRKKSDTSIIIRLDIISYYDHNKNQEPNPWAYFKNIITVLPADYPKNQVLTLPVFTISNNDEHFVVKIDNMILFQLKKAIEIVKLRPGTRMITAEKGNTSITCVGKCYTWVN